MWMAEISVDLIQMVYYHAGSCAISPSAFLLYVPINLGVLGISFHRVIMNADVNIAGLTKFRTSFANKHNMRC